MHEGPNDFLADVQKTKPNHAIPIHRVGIEGLKIPIYISQMNGVGPQHTVADVSVFVDLDGESKGTHMSRLAISVQEYMDRQLDSNVLQEITETIRQRCEAETAEVIYKFPYFIKKMAPVSKHPGIIYAEVIFNVVKTKTTHRFIMGVTATTTSLCPCSREISDASAHNQRSKVTITVSPKNKAFIWIEELIQIAEDCSSCDIYSVLKREDEKHTTEKAYDNPYFVEDMVRSVYMKLIDRSDIEWFKVEVSNEESIHQHNAIAKIDSKKR
jgi:GTP cyclohydrolase IB